MSTKTKYKIINGTYYSAGTPCKVIQILERSRVERGNYRLVIFYGDSKTGRAWGDIIECFVDRSTGTKPIPLEIYNKRSLGGGGMLDDCIVKILSARGKYLLYKHPDYHTSGTSFYGKNAKYA